MLKSWKTTLLGAAAGAANLMAHGTGWKQVVATVAVTLLGAFAKDASA